MRIHELKYSNTNTYLIVGERTKILFDTGWAGTFPAFCQSMGELGIPVQDIDYILISHFHPDHMGIAQDIADLGATIVIADVQQAYVHAADEVLMRDAKASFRPIDDDAVQVLPVAESRGWLHGLGIEGEILHTPGHSDDSISLMLDSGELFVGDLNPLYELDLHRGTTIGESWDKLFALKPTKVYYGHAKSAEVERGGAPGAADLYSLVSRIMHMIDKGVSQDKIRKKTGADMNFIEDVTRMYLTHRDVGVQGILDRIEIKGK